MAESPQGDSSGSTGIAVAAESPGGVLEQVIETSMPLSDLQQIRFDKAERLRDAGTDPYPTRSTRTGTAASARSHYQEVEASLGEHGEDEEVQTLVGRLVSRRHQGKTVFGHLRDGSGEIQLYIRRDEVGDDVFEDFLKLYDVGDFVQATGHLFRTRAGEITLRVRELTMLSKALNAPPEKWHGLQDV